MSRDEAFAAALSALPGMGPATLARLLEGLDPVSAWKAVLAGRVLRPERQPGASGRRPPDFRPWAQIAGRLDPIGWWERHAGSGVSVTWIGQADFPAALTHDPHPPGVLFWRGDLSVLRLPCVAVVGTRNATPDGRAIAFEMGRDLAGAGICVVSGLALGIDGAAHAGSLRAIDEGAPGAPAGVAASGADVPYPRRHGELWRQVTERGVIISENLPGRPAQAWRFPSRNRIIAGLVRMVVIVESHASGGSLITAEAALERGVDVRVVPGPVHSPASVGSNQLLYDGPGPVRDATDVLDALGMFRPAPPPRSATGRSGPATGRSEPASEDRASSRPGNGGRGQGVLPGTDRVTEAVLGALQWRPATVSTVMARSGLDAATVTRCLQTLQGQGVVAGEAGWWSRIGRKPPG